ncbi:glycosyltransferase family 2 protein [Thalassotalea nanhaiensis]|uniref:Glycosyltransferase family 2 protein n=1 Tax=Thalassotalea nanhaiensis TaxID=3065648 RepID=A0ABY9TPF4_9GAMM|nr:glycosyltransferase family 2 protein [Colwelliaceae bacterium SQ345]
MSNAITHKQFKKPQVSVIIPMFNVEKYINKCISSVLDQTFNDFEVICVDDGCKDSTLAKLKQFNDPRIRLIQQVNRGLAGARNTGISHAKGQYIALLDADDFWHEDKLAKHVSHLNSRPSVGISYCSSLFVNDDDKPLGIGQFPKLKNIRRRDVLCRNPIGNGSAPVMRKAMLIDYVNCLEKGLCSKTFRNKGREKCHQVRTEYFYEKLKQSEDIEFWLRLSLSTSWKFEGIGQALTFYRINPHGLSSNLEAQFSCWKAALALNKASQPSFFNRYYSLAKAYQFRYFARRAIQSGKSDTAWLYMGKALKTNFRIIYQEPLRTLNTLLCTVLLKLLPYNVYKSLEKYIMGQMCKLKAEVK